MSRPGAALAAVWLLTGCASPEGEGADRRSAVVVPPLDATAQTPKQPAAHDAALDSRRPVRPHGRPAPVVEVSAVSSESEAGSVAAHEIIRRLETEDLYVLDLHTDLDTVDEGDARVRVRVLYGTGRGHPTEATYRVVLRRVEGQWTVTSITAVP